MCLPPSAARDDEGDSGASDWRRADRGRGHHVLHPQAGASRLLLSLSLLVLSPPSLSLRCLLDSFLLRMPFYGRAALINLTLSVLCLMC